MIDFLLCFVSLAVHIAAGYEARFSSYQDSVFVFTAVSGKIKHRARRSNMVLCLEVNELLGHDLPQISVSAV